MSYHEIEEHEDHFVMHHANGHEVKIAKKALNPSTLKKIQGFSKGGEVEEVPQSEADKFNQGWLSQSIAKPKPKLMADGGEVKDPTAQLQQDPTALPVNYSSAPPVPQEEAPQAPPSNFNMLIPSAETLSSLKQGATDMMFPRQPDPNVKQASDYQEQLPQEAGPQNVPLQAPQKPAMNPLLGSQGKFQEEAYQTQKAGLQKESQTEAQLGKAQTGIYGNQQQALQTLHDNYNASRNKLLGEEDELKKKYLNQEIDPNRLWQNMSTGKKFRTTLGLILSGFGSGLAHQENLALKMLNKMVDDDLEAQKAMLGKGKTLLDHNVREQGNLQDAMNVQKLQVLGIAEAELQKAAANAKSPMAAAKYDKALGELQTTMAPLREQTLMRKTLMSGMQSGKQNPEVMASYAIDYLVPKEQQKDAREELQGLTGYKNASEGIDKIFRDVGGMSAFSTSIPFTKSKTSFETAVANIELVLRNSMKGQGSLSDRDVDAVRPYFPSRTDTQSQLNVKASRIKDFLANKIQNGTPILSKLGYMGIELPKPSNKRQMSVGQGYTQAGFKK